MAATLTVWNSEATDAVPPFGCVSPTGETTDDGLLKVTKPNAGKAVLVNGPVPIPAGSPGRCSEVGFGAVVGLHPDDIAAKYGGATPMAAADYDKDSLGVKDGDWFLRYGQGGYRPLALATSGAVMVRPEAGGGASFPVRIIAAPAVPPTSPPPPPPGSPPPVPPPPPTEADGPGLYKAATLKLTYVATATPPVQWLPADPPDAWLAPFAAETYAIGKDYDAAPTGEVCDGKPVLACDPRASSAGTTPPAACGRVVTDVFCSGGRLQVVYCVPPPVTPPSGVCTLYAAGFYTFRNAGDTTNTVYCLNYPGGAAIDNPDPCTSTVTVPLPSSPGLRVILSGPHATSAGCGGATVVTDTTDEPAGGGDEE